MGWFDRPFHDWGKFLGPCVVVFLFLWWSLEERSAAVWATACLASVIVTVLLFADFLRWHEGKAPPYLGRIACIQSMIGILMIWGPLVFADNHLHELFTMFHDPQSLGPKHVYWPLNLLLAPEADSHVIWHSYLQSFTEASQGIAFSRLIARTLAFFIPILWTMLIAEHFLWLTCGMKRGTRLVSLVAVGTLLHFMFAWRWIPNEVVFERCPDVTGIWLLGSLAVFTKIAFSIAKY